MSSSTNIGVAQASSSTASHPPSASISESGDVKAKKKVPYVPTPAQLAAQEAKRAARAAKAAAAPPEESATKRSKQQIESGRFKKRDWLDLRGLDGGGRVGGNDERGIRVLSWNVSRPRIDGRTRTVNDHGHVRAKCSR